jgi:hypothetical protein
MRYVYSLLIVLLLALPLHAQRERPETDVGVGEDTFALATLEENGIILYITYNDNANVIRSVSLWNDTDAAAQATVQFDGGLAPVDITAAPNSRESVTILSRAYQVVSRGGRKVVSNVRSFNLGYTGSVAIDRSRVFPLPTER